MKRLGLALFSAMLVTVGLFYFMSVLIHNSGEFKAPNEDSLQIDFVRIKNDSDLETRRRQLPKKPPEPKMPPRETKLNLAQNATPNKLDLKMETPNIKVPFSLGDGPFLAQAGGAGNSDNEVLPLVRVEPTYPRKAAMAGQEGWVVLEFDITPAGTIANVDVVDSQPRRIFDSAARQALLRWRYKPKTVDGSQVAQLGNTVRIDFKLDGGQ